MLIGGECFVAAVCGRKFNSRENESGQPELIACYCQGVWYSYGLCHFDYWA